MSDYETTVALSTAMAKSEYFEGGLIVSSIDKLIPHLHKEGKEEGIKTNKISKTFKMFLAVTIHNIPEGLSVGIAYGIALANWNSNPTVAIMGALMLAIGIGIQNIPEGAVVSLMYKGENTNNKKSFLLGVLSGIVEPIAAIFGLVLAMQIKTIMPWALSFAAGCMLYELCYRKLICRSCFRRFEKKRHEA